jgi:DNA-binding response OmpR family regulator
MDAPTPLPKVVVLDDEPTARNLLERFLKKRGYEAVKTATVDEALNALRLGPVAVILDVRLADERSGIDVLRMFRREMPEVKAPVIILTGAILSDEEELEIVKNRGFLFHKPESLDVLMNFMEQLLGTDTFL